MAKSLTLRSLAVACSLIVTGCAVGPDFHSPAASVPTSAQFARYEAGDVKPSGSLHLPVFDVRDADFWTQFGDEQLTALVQQALTGNRDLHAAFARLQGADAMLNEARLDRFPTVTMNGEAAQQKLSEDQLSPGQPRSARNYNAQIQASWELDLYGRVRRTVEAQQAQQQMTQADLAALQVVIAAQVADTYTQLRGTQLRMQIALSHAQNQRDTARLVDRRLHAGMGTDLDQSRAQAQLQSTLARLPALQAQISVLQHRLAVLLGESPESLIAHLDAVRPLPQVPSMLDPGTPAELLRRRPDIAAAEARLHAATARIGIATADLFPRLSLGGLLGSFALSGHNLFNASTATSNVFLGVDWSFLDIGRVRARIAASEAGAAEALANYQQTVLGALEETENALVRLNRNRDELQTLQAAVQQRNKAEHLAQRMYQSGTLGLFEVLDAQREQLDAQDIAAESQINAVRSSIALYKAMSGRWDQAADLQRYANN
ncbi:RND transporter [Bordetella tumbae]|uniref:efflux transporter outer membrane subunit n=1 Tax=Bordetella tumbae TaxID=1649139 RepID=UPI0039EECB84